MVVSDESNPILAGIVEVSRQFDIINDFKLVRNPIAVGILPVRNGLFWRNKLFSFDKYPMEQGMLELNELYAKLIVLKFAREENDSGMEPLRSLCCRFRYCSLTIRPIKVDIVPVK